MISRKRFLKTTLLGGLAPLASGVVPFKKNGSVNKPVVISTWKNEEVNRAAWDILSKDGYALDAAEAGARIPEADPGDTSVGLGGFPDREGKVTLDACIMDERGRCGSVVFLEHIVHPVSVARKVMEETDHVMLAGEGALQFALQKGFEKQELLTDYAREAWEQWKNERQQQVPENHDTIGILALDDSGRLCGACTTSGAAMKLHGRVGDSPIIGAGLYVDNEVGAAAATGRGEEVVRIAGSHLVVERMRQGATPEEACRQAVEKIIKWNGGSVSDQVGFIALNNRGAYGGYAIQKGFQYTVHDRSHLQVYDSPAVFG